MFLLVCVNLLLSLGTSNSNKSIYFTLSSNKLDSHQFAICLYNGWSTEWHGMLVSTSTITEVWCWIWRWETATSKMGCRSEDERNVRPPFSTINVVDRQSKGMRRASSSNDFSQYNNKQVSIRFSLFPLWWNKQAFDSLVWSIFHLDVASEFFHH